jgi:hypothetical protein
MGLGRGLQAGRVGVVWVSIKGGAYQYLVVDDRRQITGSADHRLGPVHLVQGRIIHPRDLSGDSVDSQTCPGQQLIVGGADHHCVKVFLEIGQVFRLDGVIEMDGQALSQQNFGLSQAGFHQLGRFDPTALRGPEATNRGIGQSQLSLGLFGSEPLQIGPGSGEGLPGLGLFVILCQLQHACDPGPGRA